MALGVVLAGGKSTRFGSDKAQALFAGQTLLERALATLGQWCDDVVIAGRETPLATCIPDWPRADMGPLGGIAAALRHGKETGHDTVLTCGVDSVDLPKDLLNILSPAPAYLEAQPVIGHWESQSAETVEAILNSDGRHSMRAFAKAVNARAISSADTPANINTPADLAAMENSNGI